MSTTHWPAPAKLNLFLHVVGRRDDGYHELQTVFQFLDLADDVAVELRDDGVIRRTSGDERIPQDADLVVRAARLLREAGDATLGADIAVTKRIPMGAGLGGGSSDAATTLLALDRLWGLGLGTDRLAGIGLALGADVPVFVRGTAAWAEGVGERLEPVELETPWYLVVDPGCAIATAEVFGHPALTRNTPPLRIRDFLAPGGGQALSLRAILEGTGNDCEAVARSLYPVVGDAIAWLSRYGRARMTGTGACVFAAFPSREEAERAHADLPAGWVGYVARGLNRSPVLALV